MLAERRVHVTLPVADLDRAHRRLALDRPRRADESPRGGAALMNTARRVSRAGAFRLLG